jgi:hypothetical protein
MVAEFVLFQRLRINNNNKDLFDKAWFVEKLIKAGFDN